MFLESIKNKILLKKSDIFLECKKNEIRFVKKSDLFLKSIKNKIFVKKNQICFYNVKKKKKNSDLLLQTKYKKKLF